MIQMSRRQWQQMWMWSNCILPSARTLKCQNFALAFAKGPPTTFMPFPTCQNNDRYIDMHLPSNCLFLTWFTRFRVQIGKTTQSSMRMLMALCRCVTRTELEMFHYSCCVITISRTSISTNVITWSPCTLRRKGKSQGSKKTTPSLSLKIIWRPSLLVFLKKNDTSLQVREILTQDFKPSMAIQIASLPWDVIGVKRFIGEGETIDIALVTGKGVVVNDIIAECQIQWLQFKRCL